MPSAVTRSPRANARKAAAYQNRDRKSKRAISSEEAQSELYGSDHDSDATLSEGPPLSLDEPWLYTFESGENVWVRTTGGNWHSGRVTGLPKVAQVRQGEGWYYKVFFNGKFRKWFAPLNGEIKPDNVHVRHLLKEHGWI